MPGLFRKNKPGTFFHNGLGQRVRKTVDGEVLEYRYGLDGELLAILDDSGQPVREFVYLNRQPLAVVDHGSDALYYVHNDHPGTPRAMSDETGTRVWTAVYDPFGAATVDEDPDQDGISVTLNVRFPGQYYDAETGLHYNYYRTYDPSTGRYLESDPIGLNGGLNTYGYALQNPLAMVDPRGLDPDFPDFNTYLDKWFITRSLSLDNNYQESTPLGLAECASSCILQTVATIPIEKGAETLIVKKAGQLAGAFARRSLAIYGAYNLAVCLDECAKGNMSCSSR